MSSDFNRGKYALFFKHLLQAHEDGNVVFFCGSGIPAIARLPLFEGLVKKLYRHFKPDDDQLTSIQKRTIKKGNLILQSIF